jgi:hypothetical protein
LKQEAEILEINWSKKREQCTISLLILLSFDEKSDFTAQKEPADEHLGKKADKLKKDENVSLLFQTKSL